MSDLRAVFFDIDDTLFSTREFAEQARRNSINAMIDMGLRVPADKLLVELEEVVAEFSSNYEHHFDKLLLRIPRKQYRGINPALIIAAGISAYHDTKFRYLRPYEDVYEVLKILSDTSLVLGVITAGLEIKQAEKLVRTRLARLFSPSAIFISDQLGISKPNIKLFQRACSDLNLKPTESMYVGNSPRLDIDPPNKLGMFTVQVTRPCTAPCAPGETAPDWTIHNFWELLDLLQDRFQLKSTGSKAIQADHERGD